ncbi:nuclear transport factor 2 family protein [Stenotrophomonas sp. 24(2023)]|uniref:nuclear transport factor 2 family protein n=1 Tax=Stenotrophomonas sp. 24(2023) TaxID=3068324 RepID=UPI0027DF7848|nr:nuclear transport factor 2 family protein [Stenotrophomonas sp. 24(2023)]WMJ68612.1 nuclear transport factor 2 family protein [Stenotrophomonas sp. 24(2023)]
MPLLALLLFVSRLFAPDIATPDSLHAQILQADRQLFAAAFDTCDAAKAAARTTDDLEFFHDKGGKVASNRSDFQASIAQRCAAQAASGGPVLQRRLLAGSMEVFPLQQDRALQFGRHRFYEVQADGHARLTGEARFVHLWRRVNGQWQVERVISYDHQPAG